MIKKIYHGFFYILISVIALIILFKQLNLLSYIDLPDYIVSSDSYLLRYADSGCSGYFNSGIYNQGYPFPTNIFYANAFDLSNGAIAFQEKNKANVQSTLIHILMLTGEEKIVKLPFFLHISSFDISNNDDFLLNLYSDGGKSILYDLKTFNEPKRIGDVEHLRNSIIHPTQPFLVGIYYDPTQSFKGSKTIGLFGLESFNAESGRFFELDDFGIREIADWSASGRVLAVIQYAESGQIPYYLLVEDGTVLESQFKTFSRGCVKDVAFAPQEEMLVYSGLNEQSQGWDIFLERIIDNPSLLNLTNTPQEDEISSAWSPDGQQVVYVKGYKDQEGVLRQELFLIDIKDSNFSAVQLTDSKTSLKANPHWVSDDEIIYFNWLPQEEQWELMSINIKSNTVNKVKDIPLLWYESP